MNINTTKNGPVCVVCITGERGLEVTNQGKMELGSERQDIQVKSHTIFKDRDGEFKRKLPDGTIVNIKDQDRAQRISVARQNKEQEQGR